ncbi:MAG: hypothetical protein ACLTT1_06455 [[Clostridium] scindens]
MMWWKKWGYRESPKDPHVREKATQVMADYPNITEGSMMPTTYTVTLKYHRNPYIVESYKVLNKWTLTEHGPGSDYALLELAQAPQWIRADSAGGKGEGGRSAVHRDQ